MIVWCSEGPSLLGKSGEKAVGAFSSPWGWLVERWELSGTDGCLTGVTWADSDGGLRRER